MTLLSQAGVPQSFGLQRSGWLGKNRATLILIGVLVVAFAVRAYVVWNVTYFVGPDEIFQYFEQAHRLVFGTGVVPLEVVEGLRSLLLPGFAASIMAAASAFGHDPWIYVLAVKLATIILSLSVVYIGFRLAQRQAGLLAAAATGLFCASWFELVYFSSALMTEEVGAHCALWALYLGDIARESRNRRTAICSGAFAALALCLRIQLAPALALAVVWEYRRDWKLWEAFFLGGVPIFLLAAGVLDWLTWGAPFHSIWVNLLENVASGLAARLGTLPLYAYVLGISYSWSVATLPLALLAMFGARRAPALALFAASVLLSHSFIGHKEYRFIYPALMVVPILTGLGGSRAAEFLYARYGAWAEWLTYTGSALAFAAVSYYAGTQGLLASAWQNGRSDILVFAAAHRQADLCGLAVSGINWWRTGGYTYLNRDVPLYYSDSNDGFGPDVGAVSMLRRFKVIVSGAEIPQYPGVELLSRVTRYNYLIAPANAAPGAFSQISCFEDAADIGSRAICLFKRTGSCH
jgi:GPI mannosyltransferase 3